MSEFKYCIACLSTDDEVIMYSLDTFYNGVYLRGAFAEMILKDIPNSSNICYICSKLLVNYNKFRNMCCVIQNFLSNLNTQVTKNIIDCVNKEHNNLKINLSISQAVKIGLYEFNVAERSAEIKVERIDDEQNCGVFTFSERNIDYDEDDSLSNETKCSSDENVEHKLKLKKLLQKQTYVENKNDHKITEKSTEIKCEKKDAEKYYDVLLTVEDESTDHEDDDDYVDVDDDSIYDMKSLSHKKNTKILDIKKNKSKSPDKSMKKKPVKNNKQCNDEKLPKSPKTSKTENVSKKDMRYKVLQNMKDFATVKELTKEEAIQAVLVRKESENYRNSSYKCDMCYRGFISQKTFENHQKKHTVAFGPNKCDICHLYMTKPMLRHHHFNSHQRIFECKLCPYSCFGPSQIKTHINRHKGLKYPCKDCDEVFNMRQTLSMHRREKHGTANVCAICGNVFPTSKGLYGHMCKIHKNETNEKLGPECKECDVHFASEAAWKLHLVLSSKHQVQNGCKTCGETFLEEAELKKHMKIHTRNYIRLRCPVCKVSFKSRREYNQHLKDEHPDFDPDSLPSAKQHVCEICGKTFKLPCFLRMHHSRHHAEPKVRPPNKFNRTCEHCGRNFIHSGSFRKHNLMHLGIRPHKCPDCDKTFINACDMRVHIKCAHHNMPYPSKRRKIEKRKQ